MMFTPIGKLLRWIAAVDETLLDRFPSDRTRLGNLGLAMLVPAGLAAAGAGTLVRSVGGGYMATAVAALITGGVIATIDRFLVISARMSLGGGQRRWGIFLRALLTFASTFTVSAAVVLAMFAGDAKEQLRKESRTEAERVSGNYAEKLADLETQARILEEERQRRDTDALAARKLAADEALGESVAGATGKRGLGPVFQERERAAARAEGLRADFQKLYESRLADIRGRRGELENAKGADLQALEKGRSVGVLGLAEALGKLRSGSLEVQLGLAGVALFLLVLDFLAIWAVELCKHAPYEEAVRAAQAQQMLAIEIEQRAAELTRPDRIEAVGRRIVIDDRAAAGIAEVRLVGEMLGKLVDDRARLEAEIRRMRLAYPSGSARKAVKEVVEAATERWTEASKRTFGDLRTTGEMDEVDGVDDVEERTRSFRERGVNGLPVFHQ